MSHDFTVVEVNTCIRTNKNIDKHNIQSRGTLDLTYTTIVDVTTPDWSTAKSMVELITKLVGSGTKT